MPLVVAIVFCFASVSSVFALSDDQYKKFMQESPAFAQAEKRLNTVWKQLKGAFSKNQYEVLLKSQKEWNFSREYKAQDIQAEAGGRLSLADGYAMLADKRADKLEHQLKSATKSPTHLEATGVYSYINEDGYGTLIFTEIPVKTENGNVPGAIFEFDVVRNSNLGGIEKEAVKVSDTKYVYEGEECTLTFNFSDKRIAEIEAEGVF